MVSDVNAAMSTTIPTCSFCSVTADINAVYQGGITAPLVAPVTFTSPESSEFPARLDLLMPILVLFVIALKGSRSCGFFFTLCVYVCVIACRAHCSL